VAVRIYDTLSRQLRPLETRDPGRVAMYGCGPTVYNFAHVGNVRTFLWYDLIRRYLEYRGYEVTYVMNYTDVDDKIIERAAVEGLPADAVAKKYARALEEDLDVLGVRPPDILSRATEHIEDMVKAVQGLVERGVAYEADGDVFFSVESHPGYGKLSRRTLEEMRAGERVEPSASKRHPLDFALWKAAKEGEPSWPSPWGPGRPGWHIECSVMSTKYLGMGFDIHAGAADLIFPHHENEIAQAEALAEQEPFVRYWAHAGLVQMEAEKMSKSLGNVVLAGDALEHYPAEVVRYWAITGSYRSQVSFSEPALRDALQAHERLRTFLEVVRHALAEDAPRPPTRPVRASRDGYPEGPGGEFVERFCEAMDDDFNSAEALAAIHELVRAANKRVEGVQTGEGRDRRALLSLTEAFVEITSVLGLEFPAGREGSELVSGLVEYLLELRSEARAEKSFERADAIRARLRALGVAIEDTPAGTRWRLTEGERAPEA
jgi:cysteinyl-tRNA synthetase